MSMLTIYTGTAGTKFIASKLSEYINEYSSTNLIHSGLRLFSLPRRTVLFDVNIYVAQWMFV